MMVRSQDRAEDRESASHAGVKGKSAAEAQEPVAAPLNHR